MRDVRIVYNGMFKNEAGIIRDMLESIYKHIDYYVIQDNGSTDGTPDIIKQFFDEKNIPGIIYFEPWVNFGYNRNHTLQKCLEAPHNCEYIIRVDADEILEVADDFDWSMLRTKDAWNVYCNYNGWSVHRMWIWSTKLPWEFTEFSRHETIQLKTEAGWSTGTLPDTFKHVLKGGGATWTNPYKFAIDGLELEKDQLNFFLKKNKLDSYHYYYIGRSYAYHFGDGSVEIKYPFEGYKEEIGRRCIWFYDCWMDKFYPNHREDGFTCPDWWVSSAYTTAALIHLHLNETDLFLKKSLKAYVLNPERNDSMYRVIEYYFKRKEYLLAMNYCKFIINNKFNNQNDTDPSWYSDVSWKLPEMYIKSALTNNHIQEAIEGSRLIRYSSYYENVPETLKQLVNTYS